MRLEKIEITGFKSFADKTILKFDDSVTAIVGPNGCGKSNIVDAFRWVLGEGSAKSLRSDKMIDVIFSGSSTRKALNYAQIALTFTHIKKTLSLDYEELCIMRRIHRNGDSEWYVNRNPVRLKDVHKILWEAGIGKNAFYIFEQGKVDDLITSSPLERRSIFEEAAKIMHFKEKKRESLRKLSHVEDNLKRVLDIQSEVNQQIDTLQKQAEEARIFAENKKTLTTLERGLLLYKWNHNQKKYSQAKERCEENLVLQKKMNTEIIDFEEKLKNLKETHSKKASETRTLHESFYEVKKSKELASFEASSHRKQSEELLKQTNTLKENLQALHHKHLREHRTFEENQKALKTYENDVVSLSKNLQNINGTLTTLEQTVEQESSQRKEAQQKLMTAVSYENDLQSEYKNNSAKLHSQKQNLANILHDEKTCILEIQEKETLCKKLEQSTQELELVLQQEQTRLQEVKADLETKMQSQEALSQKQKECTSQLTGNKAKLDILLSLKNELDGFNQSSKTLLKFASQSEHKLYKKVSPLTDWFQPKKGFDAHLCTILQPYLQTLVVKTNADLNSLLEIAKEQNLHNFSCFSLEKLSLNSSTDDLELAKSNEVACHFLNAIRTNTNENSFNQIDGDYFLDHLGVHHRISGTEQNVFLREMELKKREHDQQALESEALQIQDKIASSSQITSSLKEERSKLNQNAHKNELDLTRMQSSLKNYSESLERQKNKLTSFESQKNELSTSIVNLESKQKEYIQKCSKQEVERKDQQTLFSQIESQFETNFSSLKEKRGLKQSLEDKIKKSERESQQLKESIRVFESKSKSFEDQIKEIGTLIQDKDDSYKELEKQNVVFLRNVKEFESKLKIAEERYKTFERAVEQLEREEKQKEVEIKALRTQLNEERNREVELKGRLSEIKTEIHIQTEEIQEKLHVSEDEIKDLEVDSSITLGKTEREIRRLRKLIEEQPEVNLKAISDCEAQKSRFEFLQSQVDDLHESQKKLLEIITKLDDTSRQMFKETFEKIRLRFQENFLLLFNGGEADLKLSSHEDILDAGIDIVAQPPGKKMRSIQLLSGGEKCLCAVALLFALFETQSIPFCILDEIDAPLDDTNIERFTNVLRQFVKDSQFVIITHNKRTMAIADNLLGVSMQEKGVTKIIPLEFKAQKASADRA
ncbi:MAG: Chromosome partition protein Smc [Chlamydiae bacterium]|nr:Chromosome partition protein Smc [Chlamydiota bacterium]